jgi:hypothetical protein
MQWDTIPGSSYPKVNAIQPYVGELRKRSEARVAADRDFAYLQDEIARFKKVQDDKAVSLNEAQRMKERQEADAKAEAWKKEAQARTEPNEKVILLTVAQAALPGLPPPVGRTTARANTPHAAGSDLPADASTGLDDPGSGDALARGANSLVTDITLREANRILLDLISLSSKTPGSAQALAGAINKR